MSFTKPARRGAVLAALALLLAAAGCGDDTTESSSGTTSTLSATTSTEQRTTTSGKTETRPTTTAPTTTQRQDGTTTITTNTRPATTTPQPTTTAPKPSSSTTTTTKSTPAVKGRRINFQPRLRVQASRYDAIRGSRLTIEVTQRTDERRLSRMSVAIPAGYGLDQLRNGTRVGELAVDVVGPGKQAQLPPLVLEGQLRSAKPVGSSCAAKPIWLLRTVAVPGTDTLQPVRLPLSIYVHKVGNSRRMAICLPAAPLPGNRTIRRVSLEFSGGIRPPGPGNIVWRGVFTPKLANAASAKASTTESRGIVPLPSFLTMEPVGKRTVGPGADVTLRGTLSLNGPSVGKTVEIYAARDRSGFKRIGRAKTIANGSWTFRTTAPRSAGLIFYQAIAPWQAVRCTAGRSAEAPAGCTGTTVAGIDSPSVRYTITNS